MDTLDGMPAFYDNSGDELQGTRQYSIGSITGLNHSHVRPLRLYIKIPVDIFVQAADIHGVQTYDEYIHDTHGGQLAARDWILQRKVYSDRLDVWKFRIRLASGDNSSQLVRFIEFRGSLLHIADVVYAYAKHQCLQGNYQDPVTFLYVAFPRVTRRPVARIHVSANVRITVTGCGECRYDGHEVKFTHGHASILGLCNYMDTTDHQWLESTIGQHPELHVDKVCRRHFI